MNKGPGGAMAKRLEIKGRSKMGIRKKYKAKMVVMLREGRTLEEKKAKEKVGNNLGWRAGRERTR